MPRYFLAVPLPDDAKDRLVSVQPPAIPGMRLLLRQELHLTLHFLGELTVQTEELARKALTGIKANAFAITIRGIGRFPSVGQPQVLWAGVQSSAALFALHHSVATVLTEAIGYQPEIRPYSPHVTLARLNAPVSSGVVEHYLEENKDYQAPSVLVKQIALYSSVLTKTTPQYRQEAKFDLLNGEKKTS